MKVAWSATHREFLLSDGYYFSGLYRELSKKGIVMEEVEDFDKLFEYDVIVFNYPENPFTDEEKKEIRKLLESYKKKIIFTTHFRNKDRVSEICNGITRDYGIYILPEGVKDEKFYLEDDFLIITTDNIELYNQDVKEVVFPYAAPLHIEDEVDVVLRGRETSFTDSNKNSPILIAQKRFDSGGKLMVCGSCIFWDNFSLFRFDNLRFVINMFLDME
ncbi:hypothetical protein [Thermoanaerobacter mathranii]|uniref:hypothetical protein n=1 Tax=Thermoanaerobacter mathranii TaxID=583357 RepID=UPI003D6A3AC4